MMVIIMLLMAFFFVSLACESSNGEANVMDCGPFTH